MAYPEPISEEFTGAFGDMINKVSDTANSVMDSGLELVSGNKDVIEDDTSSKDEDGSEEVIDESSDEPVSTDVVEGFGASPLTHLMGGYHVRKVMKWGSFILFVIGTLLLLRERFYFNVQKFNDRRQILYNLILFHTVILLVTDSLAIINYSDKKVRVGSVTTEWVISFQIVLFFIEILFSLAMLYSWRKSMKA